MAEIISLRTAARFTGFNVLKSSLEAQALGTDHLLKHLDVNITYCYYSCVKVKIQDVAGLGTICLFASPDIQGQL